MSSPGSPRVALATSAALAQLTDDDQHLARALRACGARADAAVWSDPAVPWRDYDLVVLRSCWDYHLRLEEFLRWVDRLATGGVALRNPPALIRWNAHKRYLRELAESGVPVVPTAWIRPGGLARALEENGWDDVVVKPAVGGSAYGTLRVQRATAVESERRLAELLGSGAESDELLVQPFVPEIVSDGEWSLLFLSDGSRLRFSHAVRKRPARGDFRVQREHGGTADPGRPEAGLVAEAQAALARACRLASVPERELLYARVDGVERGGRLELMELECIEPELFFAFEASAAGRLSAGLMSALAASRAGVPPRRSSTEPASA